MSILTCYVAITGVMGALYGIIQPWSIDFGGRQISVQSMWLLQNVFLPTCSSTLFAILGPFYLPLKVVTIMMELNLLENHKFHLRYTQEAGLEYGMDEN